MKCPVFYFSILAWLLKKFYENLGKTTGFYFDEMGRIDVYLSIKMALEGRPIS